MKKSYSLLSNVLLLIWFSLDMVGIYFKDTYLVTRSWKEDGVFMLIFIVALLLFALKESVGQYVLVIWQALWLFTQFISHERYTLFGGGEKKMVYFKDSVKLVHSEIRYIPDLYHLVLHILIAVSLFLTVRYIVKNRGVQTKKALNT